MPEPWPEVVVFDWLFEGRQSVYLVLAALAVLLGAFWAWTGFPIFRERRAKPNSRRPSESGLAFLPIMLAVIVLLAGCYFLMDRLVETNREQIERKLQEMARAVRARDADRIFSHISESFDANGRNKAAFREYVVSNFRVVDELVVWEISFPDDSGKVQFNAKPRGSAIPGEAFVLVRGTFVRDADGQWRLQTFTLSLPNDPSGSFSLP